MVSFINAVLISGWLVLSVSTLLMAWFAKRDKEKGGYWDNEERKISRHANQAGVTWGSKETKMIWLISISAAGGLYVLTGNLMLIAIAWPLMLVLPRLLIHSRKHRRRLETLTILTDCLRQLLARLPDQGSLIRAMEMVAENDSRGENAVMLAPVLEELRLGSNVRDAIGFWQGIVGLKKFDHVAETLIQANADGWTPAALNALDKSVQGLEGDRKAVLLAAQKAAGGKRQLFMVLGTAWSFPVILSMMDAGQQNLYLHTMQGKLLIFAYVAVSLYVIVKGQEYLSLNVDEL